VLAVLIVMLHQSDHSVAKLSSEKRDAQPMPTGDMAETKSSLENVDSTAENESVTHGSSPSGVHVAPTVMSDTDTDMKNESADWSDIPMPVLPNQSQAQNKLRKIQLSPRTVVINEAQSKYQAFAQAPSNAALSTVPKCTAVSDQRLLPATLRSIQP
jgi:hypothetical protein